MTIEPSRDAKNKNDFKNIKKSKFYTFYQRTVFWGRSHNTSCNVTVIDQRRVGTGKTENFEEVNIYWYNLRNKKHLEDNK